MVHISYSPEFLKQLKHLAKKYKSIADDLELLRDELKQNPYAGADLGGGVRKVRMSIKSKGRGKSGGARVITYLLSAIEENIDITLLTQACLQEKLGKRCSICLKMCCWRCLVLSGIRQSL